MKKGTFKQRRGLQAIEALRPEKKESGKPLPLCRQK
jgi:hypothetical protein